MKNLTLTFSLIMLVTGFSRAQEFSIKNLTAFDKLVVEGKVEKIILNQGNEDHPVVKIEGVTDKDVVSGINAGILTLSIQGNTPATVSIYNGHLKRIESPGNVEVTGAEIIGDNGNYLVVSFDRSHGGVRLAIDDHDFNVHIPDIDIDIPEIDVAVDIPDFNFDFDFDFDEKFEMNEEMNYHWESHKDELKRWSEEWKEETREAMKEAREEIKKAKEEMKRIKKIEEEQE